MELRSDDGAHLVLSIVRYQFPNLRGQGVQDWDANWLVVAGDLLLPDRRTHSFSDPCLTTWEARELAGWLGDVAEGDSEVSPGDAPGLVFTEPCLAFAACRDGLGQVELRVYLSLEAEPPFVMAGERGIHTNYVPFRLSREALTKAAREWAVETARFPVRP